MPGYTPTYSLRYPLGTERPKTADIKNLADDVDRELTALPKIQTGRVSMPYGSRAVTFAEPYTAPPVVMCNIMSGAGQSGSYRVRAINVTSTGFTAFIIRDPSTGHEEAVQVDWLAVGT